MSKVYMKGHKIERHVRNFDIILDRVIKSRSKCSILICHFWANFELKLVVAFGFEFRLN